MLTVLRSLVTGMLLASGWMAHAGRGLDVSPVLDLESFAALCMYTFRRKYIVPTVTRVP